MNERLCVFCVHWTFDGGEHGYSEMTPGYSASMDCNKRHYGRNFSLEDLGGEKDFRRIIRTAEKCPDYQEPPK